MRHHSAFVPRVAAHGLGLCASFLASLVAMCGGSVALQAWAAPLGQPLSVARLIAAERADGGSWTVGVVISLKGQAITYWRTPGEAGVPPRFDFSGSENVAASAVFYPVPQRVREGDTEANAYHGEVVFPVRLTLADPGRPARISLKLDYATCERICLPAHADLELALPPSSEAIDGDRLRQAQGAVPRVLDEAAAADVATVTRHETAGVPSWRIVPRAAGSELFAEGPDGFYLGTKRSGDGFVVTMEESPADRRTPEFLRITLVGAGGAVEFTLPGR